MSQLRKEYKEFKQIQKQYFKEAAEQWTEENIILINERIDRNAIWRLNSAIQRFDKKFGPYKEKLPAIAEILRKAEEGLQNVITGKLGKRSIAHMLQRMSIIYNIFSNFFGGDLAALLKTPAFRRALEKPDARLDEIAEEGHDLKEVRRALAAALKPNEQERILMRKVYKTFDMPTLDWNLAAKELSCLSSNGLKELAGIQRTPIVVVDENQESSGGLDETADEGVDEGIGSALKTAGGALAGAAAGAGVAAGAAPSTP